MNNKYTLYKVVRLYLISSICTLALTFFCAGFASINSSTAEINEGQNAATLALSHKEQKIEININQEKAAAIDLLPPPKIDLVLGSSPVYWFMKSLWDLVN